MRAEQVYSAVNIFLTLEMFVCMDQALIGEQYGTASLPEQVEIPEFQNVLQICQSMQLSTTALEGCYRRDENAIPPSFCLLSQYSSQVSPCHSKYILN